ncbi:DNA-directed RNA polymerase subunit P [Candidatus Woesearchaeota archaeon]|nr:DNA-directed RNA polymerase subunit P [Candidatus Woesearchaeota archaeon]MBT4114032.1 DNA-directed RNA polymerase subunit P [Candidatus Woesearchaeota archaeon]MBT4248111.1 DNA-directed RNA polymerase subunit P [Candidatus Woesearchaeota archaeon]
MATKILYKCFKCQREINAENLARRVICPFCGSRIISKARPSVIKKVKAR